MLAAPVGASERPTYHPRTLTLIDQRGDANGLNDRTAYDIGSRPTPVQNDAADLLKIQYASTARMVREGRRFVPRCSGFTVTVTLAAGPAANTDYVLSGTGVENDTLYQFWYDGTNSYILYRTGTDRTGIGFNVRSEDLITPVKVLGRTLTFTVTEADLTGTYENLAAFKISTPGASSVSNEVRWDEATPYKGAFKPC